MAGGKNCLYLRGSVSICEVSDAKYFVIKLKTIHFFYQIFESGIWIRNAITLFHGFSASFVVTNKNGYKLFIEYTYKKIAMFSKPIPDSELYLATKYCKRILDKRIPKNRALFLNQNFIAGLSNQLSISRDTLKVLMNAIIFYWPCILFDNW